MEYTFTVEEVDMMELYYYVKSKLPNLTPVEIIELMPIMKIVKNQEEMESIKGVNFG